MDLQNIYEALISFQQKQKRVQNSMKNAKTLPDLHIGQHALYKVFGSQVKSTKLAWSPDIA